MRYHDVSSEVSMRRVWIATCLLVLACGRGGDRATGAPARPAELHKMLALLAGEDDASADFVPGMAEVCGPACACLVERGAADVLIDCAAACPSEVRTKAKQATGNPIEALAAGCGAETLGLPAGRNDLASADWLRLHLAGQYIADQIKRAGSQRAAIEAELAKLTVRVPLRSSQVGPLAYRLPEALRADPLGARAHTYVLVTEKGDLRAGVLPTAVVDASGVRYPKNPTLGDDGRPVATVDELDGTLRAVRGDPPPADDAVDAAPTDDTTLTSEGKLGKRQDSPGQYKLTPDQEQLARRQAIEAARTAGVFDGNVPALQPGGAFSGIGDVAWDLDKDLAAIAGPLPRLALYGRVHHPDRRQPLLVADRAAASQRVLEALEAAGGGAIATDGGGIANAHAVVFTVDRQLRRAPSPAKIVVAWGKDALVVRTGDSVVATIPATAGTIDAGAVTQAYAAARKDLADHTGVVIALDHDVPLGAFVSVLDVLVQGGATGFDVLGKPEVPSPELAGTGGGSVRRGTLAAVGDLDKEVIRTVIKDQLAKLVACYEKGLAANPALEGTVMTQFFIAPNGAVAGSHASGIAPEVDRCIAQTIRDIKFPRPKGGGVQVNYPFTFRPSGS